MPRCEKKKGAAKCPSQIIGGRRGCPGGGGRGAAGRCGAVSSAAAMKEKGLKTSAVSKEEFAEFDHGDIPWLRNHPGLG